MPFKSKAQQRWMYATHPKMAKKWQKHTPKGKKLPEKVSKESFEAELDRILEEAFGPPVIVSVFDDANDRDFGYKTFIIGYPGSGKWEYKVPHDKAARILSIPDKAGGRKAAKVKEWAVKERKIFPLP